VPTWGPNDAGAAAAATSSGLGAGLGPHCPVGTWSGTRYRSILRWQPPAWSAWVGITSATLKVKTTDFAHVGPRNSSIYVKRQSAASGGQWNTGSGTQNCNSGFSASNNTQYSDMSPVSTNAVTFNSGTTENSWKTIDVTAMVRDYFNSRGNVDVITFVLDQDTSSDYAEFWSDDSAGNEPTLTIVYSDAAPPNAPTLGYPASGAVIKEQNPLFTWTHSATGGDPQLEAEITIWDAAGTTVVAGPTIIAGAVFSYQYPSNLPRHLSYQWTVRTKDVSGYGPQAAKRTFKVQGAPTITFPVPQRIEFAIGAPRVHLYWETLSDNPTQDDNQTDFQIESPPGTVIVAYTGTGTNGVKNKLLDAFGITDNTSYTFRVRAKTLGIPDEGFSDLVFKPRYGLTTHHKLVTPTPTDWLSAIPTLVPPQPVNTDVHMQYGSSPTSSTAPDSWQNDIGSVTPNPHVFWRAWFLPYNNTAPTLDKVVISSSGGAALDLDKWTKDATFPVGQAPKKPHVFASPWAVDRSEYVYGSRSVRCDVAAAGPYLLWSEQSYHLRAGRSYILTGLMKSGGADPGNSGACFELQDAAGNTLKQADNVTLIRSPVLTKTTLFYNTTGLDVNRYKTPVYTVGDTDLDVYVVLRAGGGAGTKAWFDAIKLEESTVATPWSPGAVGASIVDAGGIQVDASRGGVFRLKGALGGPRDSVELGDSGLLFAGDTNLTSPADGQLAIDGALISTAASGGHGHAYTPGATGSLVPVITGGGSATFTAPVCEWYQVGRVVTCRFSWTVNAAGSGATAIGVTLAGLPPSQVAFAGAGDRGGVGVVRLLARMSNVSGSLACLSISAMLATTVVALQGADLVSGAAYQFNFSYYATTDVPPTIEAAVAQPPSGAAFPASPVLNQRFFHTGYRMEFFWDGAQWLTTTQYDVPIFGQRAVFPFTVAGTMNTPAPHATMGIWGETFHGDTYVGAPNDASNFWTCDIGGGASFTTVGQATLAFVRKSVPINAVICAPGSSLQVAVGKTGSPGSFYPLVAVSYRLIGV
jgi:hypothetical protein